MSETAEELERRIAGLRVALRKAVLGKDAVRASSLRAELRAAERTWDDLLAEAAGTNQANQANQANQSDQAEADQGNQANRADTRTNQGPLLPLREQVHEALSLLTVPAAPKLIATVHEAFFAHTFATSKLTSLKRDEERSFRLAPFARPYYICAALTADRLSQVRGLLAVSTWRLERRVIGPLSPRVDFLTSAIRIAEAAQRLPEPTVATQRLLWRFSANIPGAPAQPATMVSHAVIAAAQAELDVHLAEYERTRQAGAQRARDQLADAEQLFGTRLEQHADTSRRSG